MPLCHNSWTHAGPPSRLARTRAACTHQSFRAHTLQVDCRSGALIDVRMDDEPDCPGVTFLESGLCLLARHAVHGHAPATQTYIPHPPTWAPASTASALTSHVVGVGEGMCLAGTCLVSALGRCQWCLHSHTVRAAGPLSLRCLPAMHLVSITVEANTCGLTLSSLFCLFLRPNSSTHIHTHTHTHTQGGGGGARTHAHTHTHLICCNACWGIDVDLLRNTG